VRPSFAGAPPYLQCFAVVPAARMTRLHSHQESFGRNFDKQHGLRIGWHKPIRKVLDES
jgi:hypothetical protein